MAIDELTPPSEKKRTALYMDMAFYDEIDTLAIENGVSFNRAAIYLMQVGQEALAKKK